MNAGLLHDIATAMGGTVCGNRAIFPTPGHGKKDRGSWASIVPGAPDGVLIHSENGGDPLAIKDELRAKGVLELRETFRSAEMHTRKPRQAGVSYFEFHGVDGATACRKVRTDRPDGTKDFTWQHPDGGGGWKSGRGRAALFYNLPRLLAAPKDATIYIAEGERKADKLTSWGLIATSSKDVPDDLSPLKGRTVVILPDNDEQGADIAQGLQNRLQDVTARVVLVDLPGLPPKGDIIDWTGSPDDLQALVDAALHTPTETFQIADLSAWGKTQPAPKAFTMAGIIPQGEVTLFVGGGGTNKSTFGLQLCACSAAAVPMLGIPVTAGPALYVTAEDEDRENHWRLRKIACAIGTTLEGLHGRLHVVSLRGRLNNELATFDEKGRLHVAGAFNLLRATIEATGSRLVVLDNLAHMFIGNENDRGHVTAFVNLLYQLCRDLSATVVLIGHPNKAGDSYSGSTAWLNAVRAQIVLARPENDPDPDARVLSLGKANYARPDRQLPFRWHDFALILETDLPADLRSELAQTAQATAENAAFLRCLQAATLSKRAVSHNPGVNYAPAVFARMPQGKGHSDKAFAAAFERLLHLGTIRLDQPLWKRENRAWKFGIKLASECTDRPAPTPCTDPHQAGRTDPHAPTPLYTTYKSGAAPWPAAPDPDDLDWSTGSDHDLAEDGKAQHGETTWNR